MAGKGDKPRNCFSKSFRDNYDAITWKEEYSVCYDENGIELNSQKDNVPKQTKRLKNKIRFIY